MQYLRRCVHTNLLVLFKAVGFLTPYKDIVFIIFLSQRDLFVVWVKDLHRILVKRLVVQKILCIGSLLLVFVFDQAAWLISNEDNFVYVSEIAKNVINLAHCHKWVKQSAHIQYSTYLVFLEKEWVNIVGWIKLLHWLTYVLSFY